MLTVNDVSQEIKNLLFEINTQPRSSDPKIKRQQVKFKKATEKRIKYLNTIKLYLETNPSSEFLKSEVYRLKTALAVYETRFSQSIIPSEITQSVKLRRKLYEKENSVPKLKTQLKNLQFILKGK